ncbi:MAG: dienelactone hydrolase family protein [Immundisolibacteraceae bacterium]|nr:dienelactone hydrolase family protein [Immundisolibacteraceae bacterium]
MSSQTINIASNDQAEFNGHLVLPPAGEGPGLILGQEIFGVNSFMREMAEQYAAEGYVVLVPDLFWRLEPGVDLGYSDTDREKAFALYQQLDLDQAVDDVGTAVAALRAMPECTGKVGFLGYCLGGSLAYLTAARHDLDVAIGYYGVGIEHHLDEAANISCPVMQHIAGLDGYTPPEVVAQIDAVFATHTNLKYHLYPQSDHGFTTPEKAAYDRSATAIAYSRSLAQLRNTIGPNYDLEAIWDDHLACEFETKTPTAALETMVERPYVNHIPTMTGGTGREQLSRFYQHHFIPRNPPDTNMIPVSRTVGVDKIVDEFLFCFTHTQEIDWLLPGIAATGKPVELPMIAIVNFRGDKICHEHIYWDQATALVQVGKLDPAGLPVAGKITADKVLDEELPANTLMPTWSNSKNL